MREKHLVANNMFSNAYGALLRHVFTNYERMKSVAVFQLNILSN